MELYATGWNAWGQLRFPAGTGQDDVDKNDGNDNPDDLFGFTSVLADETIGQPRPFLSYTLVNTTPSGTHVAGSLPADHAAVRSRDDELYASVVEASNGAVVAFDQKGTLHQFTSLAELLSGGGRESFPSLRGVVQIVAYETGFAALAADGRVWTWGDERYAACLGRDVTDDSPADKPAVVSLLDDLPTGPVRKLAAGGYVLAALTSGNDLYCWGGHPGRLAVLDGLGGEPTPVAVDDNDTLDVGVGESHLILLTTGGDVFVTGDNTNGQLGLGRDAAESTGSWARVDLGLKPNQRVAGVVAGPRNSFIIVRTEED